MNRSTRLFVFLGLFLGVTAGATGIHAGELRGTVRSGDTGFPALVADVKVTLHEATELEPIVLGHTRTDANGHFSISVDKATSESVFFVTADLRRRVRFATILGPELPAATTINELTTVAAAYSMAQFYRMGEISGDSFRLRIAAGMNDNIVTPATGESSSVLLHSPNADETHSLRMTRSLANLLAFCAHNPRITRSVLRATKEDGKPVPRDTLQAFANLARNPGTSVRKLFRLSRSKEFYGPALEKAPDAWTVTIKVNDSGNDDILFGGPANVAFDASGHAWIANNVSQGSAESSDFIMVLKPNGKPADGLDGTPHSPISGAGILGVGWGISVDSLDQVWMGNFGWGGVNPSETSPGNGSVSHFLSDGTALSLPQGYFDGTFRVQAIEPDADGNLWIASYGNDRVVVFPNGHPPSSSFFQLVAHSGPFGVAPAPGGGAWVTNSGGLSGVLPSSVGKYVLTESGQVERTFWKHLGDTLKVVAVDSTGNAWIASQGDDTIYGLGATGDEIGGFIGGGVKGPWGLAVDGDDNIWVANFGPLELGNEFKSGRISKLCGANTDHCPRGKTTGDPISPATGYTVHSGGSEVLLANGEPLYGMGPLGQLAPPSFAPMMRQTSLQIDAAGNIWTVNNWKPNFDVDIASNPGGDGLIIFVGLAAPPVDRFDSGQKN